MRLKDFISSSIKYTINLVFSVIVCICKIHVFNGVIPCQTYKISWTSHPYLMELFEIFTSGIIEIWKPWKQPLTLSISKFLVLLINGKLVCLKWHLKYYFFYDKFGFKQLLVLKTHWGMLFKLKKFKNNIKIRLKRTSFELYENPNKIYHSVYICKRKRCGTTAE